MKFPNYHFEIFVPCLIDKTQRKVDINELRSLKYIQDTVPLTTTQKNRMTILENVLKRGQLTNTRT